MKLVLNCLVVLFLLHFATGCGLFFGGKTYDGSETATQELSNRYRTDPLPYMQGSDNPDDN